MTMVPRPEVRCLHEAPHGAIDFAELMRQGIDPAAILDFSVNVQPYGPSPRVAGALAELAVDRYPDRESLQLREALAQHWQLTPEQLIAGNGSSELLYLIALAYLREGDPVLVLGPTYSEYARAARLMGAVPYECTASRAAGFEMSPDRVAKRLRELQPRVCFLCNPNNPTGTLLAAEVVGRWAEEFAETLFVVDEAYIEFASGASTLAGAGLENLIVLRSLTKAHGLAGLRLGCGIAAPEIIAMLRRVRPPWSVSAAAQAAGVAAIGDQEHGRRVLRELSRAKASLVRELASIGFTPLASATHFFLLPVGDAARVRAALLQEGILVRDCTSFGLPTLIRISPRCEEENARLVEALGRVNP